jgi:hypothetical protein
MTDTLKLISKENLETTCSILNEFNLDIAMRFTTSNDSYKKSLSLIYIEFGQCGFERVSDWKRFVNKLNSYDITPIKRMVTGDKKSFDNGDVIIERTDIDYSEDGFLIKFKEPTQLVIEEIGESYAVAEVTELKGQITWEWYHRKSGHEALEGYSGICEVYLHSIEIIK